LEENLVSALKARFHGLVPRRLGLAVMLSVMPAFALGQSGPGDVDARPLDAGSCAALAAAAARGGGHFPLGRAACGLAAAPQRGPALAPAPASAHAQQLQLYAPAAAAPQASAALAGPTEGTPATAPRAGGKKPSSGQAPARGRPLPAALVRAVNLAPEIDSVAQHNQIDPLLLHAIARIESRHNPAAVSPAGARGLMQVMPATGARFGVANAHELHHVSSNLQASARYLKFLKQRFPGDLRLVLAAYNAGEGAVERHGRRIPPYAETQAYVRKVLAEYVLLRQAAGGAP
jgi:lysozyme